MGSLKYLNKLYIYLLKYIAWVKIKIYYNKCVCIRGYIYNKHLMDINTFGLDIYSKNYYKLK